MTDSRGRMLLVYPRFARNNILNYEWMMPFYPGKQAVMPPLGVLAFAARAQSEWSIRIVDENVRPLADADLAWADVVGVSGMHPQRRRITAILAAANRLGRITIVGGPSASICPEYYPSADAIHVGELGDATDELLAFLRARRKPDRQLVFRTTDKTPLDSQPMPALDCIDVNQYFMMPIQFSVGCPYTCEFCDIPMIYGRVARTKSAERVVAELEAIYERGFVGMILFVDDNLIADRKALRAMLERVIAWQKERRYPFAMTGEATINLARDRDLLRQLHDARFTNIFFGIESPEPDTLAVMSKRQNLQDPMVESIRAVQEHGIEVIFGMILGLDGNDEDSGRRMAEFVRQTNPVVVYFNLLAALPKTPLWERLEREGRLLEREGDALQSEELLSCLATNVAYRLPNDTVVRMLRETIAEVYSPAATYRRFRWNAENVYGKQLAGTPPVQTRARQWRTIQFAVATFVRVIRDVGLRADYRLEFWRLLGLLVRLRLQGRLSGVLEPLLRAPPNAHHLITWARDIFAET
jgi:radical SAM superfamily enzyme YgiQ (UPF0313 family)